MRALTLMLTLFALAACVADPKSLGITGPGTAPQDDVQKLGADGFPVLGAPASGTYYGPSYAPTTGPTGFWGYNN